MKVREIKMLVLCKDKKPEDLLKYGFEKDMGYNDKNFIGYKLMTKRKKGGKYGKKGEPIELLTYNFRRNGFNWDRGFYGEEIQKIVYILIKDNIIEYEEPFDKDERIAKLEEKIREYQDKIKELEEN
jgi:hypothetical protein